MRFGQCKWIFKKKNGRENFIGSVIENVFMKAGFSPNNPHFNRVCFFDDTGEENRCSESDFFLTDCKEFKMIDIVLWKGQEDIEIGFDLSDENYDIFELNVNLFDGEGCRELINSITALIFNNDLDLKGIIFDKFGVLDGLSFDLADDRDIDFAFNEESDLRKELTKFYGYDSRICGEFVFPVLNENSIKNIYTYIFLPNKKVKAETFEFMHSNN